MLALKTNDANELHELSMEIFGQLAFNIIDEPNMNQERNYFYNAGFSVASDGISSVTHSSYV